MVVSIRNIPRALLCEQSPKPYPLAFVPGLDALLMECSPYSGYVGPKA